MLQVPGVTSPLPVFPDIVEILQNRFGIGSTHHDIIIIIIIIIK